MQAMQAWVAGSAHDCIQSIRSSNAARTALLLWRLLFFFGGAERAADGGKGAELLLRFCRFFLILMRILLHPLPVG